MAWQRLAGGVAAGVMVRSALQLLDKGLCIYDPDPFKLLNILYMLVSRHDKIRPCFLGGGQKLVVGGIDLDYVRCAEIRSDDGVFP